MHWLVITDLDGTLLDVSYPRAEAALAIDAIARAYPEVSVVLASSKTLAEMLSLAKLCKSDPFLMFENGAGFAWREPGLCGRGTRQQGGFEVECSGAPYPEVRAQLERLRNNRGYAFRGFGDMSTAEVMARTGLDAGSALAAQQRLATEPIEWHGDRASLKRFRRDLAKLELDLEGGGRFQYVSSPMGKPRAMRRLVKQLRYQTGNRVATLACGDAPNDLAMLQEADQALVFPRAKGDYLLPEGGRVWHAPKPGPATWLACVSRVIETRTEEAIAT